MHAHPVRVAIDLETTGLHADQDAVIEIGALKFAGDEILDTFETFVSPGMAIPYRIQRLTGITTAQLAGAPTMAEVVPRLKAFLGDAPLVGHSVPFDAAFLRRVGLARRNPLVDTYELASTLLPNLSSYTLGAVGEALGVQSPTYHRALADARLARDVFLALLERLEALDATTLEMLGSIAAPPDWAPGFFVRAMGRAQRPSVQGGSFGMLAATSLGDQLAAKLGMDPRVLSLAIAPGSELAPIATRRRAAAALSDVPSTPPAVASASARPTTERAITESIAECVTTGGSLLVEAPSTVESLRSCLAAALRATSASDEHLLVSAANSEEMSRIAREVVPLALADAGIASSETSITELDEHEAYLCLHRWFGAARSAWDETLPRDVARGVAKLTVWAGQTRTGARAEVSLAGPELAAWERARAGGEFADARPSCVYRREGYCFAARAQEMAQEARVVVTTHAALAAHLAGKSSLLPEARRVLVLEAHLLEEELRRTAGFALDRRDLLARLAALAEQEQGGKRAGLLHLAAKQAERSGGQQREQAWFAQVERARQSVEDCFAALRRTLANAQEESSGGASPGETLDYRTIRLDARVRELAAWRDAVQRWAALDERLAAVVKVAREAAHLSLSTRGANAALAGDGVASELMATAHVLERIRERGAALVTGQEETTVRWLDLPFIPTHGAGPTDAAHTRRAPGGNRHAPRHGARQGPAATAASVPADDGAGRAPASGTPVDVSEYPALRSAPAQVHGLLERLHEPGRALVLASPALAVAGDFSYVRGSLGVPESARGIATLTDRSEQTLLGLPEDVVEPNMPQFQRSLDNALITLAQALGGRLVALFPSHAALRASANGIRRALERHDILVLAQGQDGSARQLWHTFRTESRVVLLGAGAFWDGTDQTDAPPACIVVTRVPFPALSDPVIAARAGAWSDPQNQFVVPHAALKLRHALDGLAWSHQRRNAVLLFDHRLQSRAYGPTVLGTLPHCNQVQEKMVDIVERITEWVDPS